MTKEISDSKKLAAQGMLCLHAAITIPSVGLVRILFFAVLVCSTIAKFQTHPEDRPISVGKRFGHIRC